MYTIFKNDVAIFIIDNLKYANHSDFYYWDKFDFETTFQALRLQGKTELFLYHTDLEKVWSHFQNKFKVIEAAGGVVQNSNKEILFIFRHEKWDLPKGKIEKNESIEIAAIREVQEECGLQQVVIDSFLEKTYHIYTENNTEILKISHWFLMRSNEKVLVPQQEEGISIVVWKDKKEVKTALQNTFPNIKLLLVNNIKSLT